MEAVLAWVIAHPLVSILGTVAVPIVATTIAALRGGPVAAPPIPAVEPQVAAGQREIGFWIDTVELT